MLFWPALHWTNSTFQLFNHFSFGRSTANVIMPSSPKTKNNISLDKSPIPTVLAKDDLDPSHDVSYNDNCQISDSDV